MSTLSTLLKHYEIFIVEIFWDIFSILLRYFSGMVQISNMSKLLELQILHQQYFLVFLIMGASLGLFVWFNNLFVAFCFECCICLFCLSCVVHFHGMCWNIIARTQMDNFAIAAGWKCNYSKLYLKETFLGAILAWFE